MMMRDRPMPGSSGCRRRRRDAGARALLALALDFVASLPAK